MVGSAGEKTADAVHEAACALFARSGYEATSLRAIASEVGIQVGSLYNHINSKHDLLQRIMVDTMHSLLQEMRIVTSGSSEPVEGLERALDCHIRFHATHSREVFIGNSELRSLEPDARKVISELRHEYERILVTLVSAVGGAGKGDVIDAQLQAFSILAIGTHVAAWYKPGASIDLDSVVRTYSEIIRRQLRISPSRALEPVPLRGTA